MAANMVGIVDSGPSPAPPRWANTIGRGTPASTGWTVTDGAEPGTSAIAAPLATSVKPPNQSAVRRSDTKAL